MCDVTSKEYKMNVVRMRPPISRSRIANSSSHRRRRRLIMMMFSNDSEYSYIKWRFVEKSKFDFKELIKAGFSYSGREDIVRCTTCGLEMGGWADDDAPQVYHTVFSPTCPFVVAENFYSFINDSIWHAVVKNKCEYVLLFSKKKF